MSSSCKDIREELIACLKVSPCMTEQGRKFHDCLQNGSEEDLGDCALVRRAFGYCKAGQVAF